MAKETVKKSVKKTTTKKVEASEVKVENATVVSDKDMIICGVKATRNMVKA